MADPLFPRGSSAAVLLMGVVLAGSMAYGITEEVKLGQGSGEVSISSNTKPLPNARVVLQPQFELPDKIKWSPRARTDDQGRFSVKGLPVGLYEVQVYGKAHNATGQIVVSEAPLAPRKFIATPSQLELELRVSQRVLSPREQPSFEVSGIAMAPTLSVDLFRLSESTMVGASVYEVAQSLALNQNRNNPAALPGIVKVSSSETKLTTSDVEGAFAETRKLKALGEGTYLMRARQGKFEKFAYFTVTTLALVVKSAGQNMMAYAVDIDSGKPAAGIPVQVLTAQGSKEAGVTNAQGILEFRRQRFNGSGAVVVAAKRGMSRAFTRISVWDSEDEDSSPSVAAGSAVGGQRFAKPGDGKIWIKTDRPIYRPGDTVSFKGVLRAAKGLSWEAASGGTATVTVTDSDENTVATINTPVNGFGTFAAKFATNSAGKPGAYRLEASYGAVRESTYVSVVPFRKPEYTVTVSPAKKAFRRGEPVVMTVKAEYYTGEPLAGAKVAVNVLMSRYWPADPLEEGYNSLRDEFSSGDYTGSVEGRTNASGEAVLSWNPGIAETKEESLSDSVVVFEAGVADPSERYFSGRGQALLTRGAFGMSSEFSRTIVAMDDKTTLTGKLENLETGKAEPGKEVAISFQRVRWERVKNDDEDEEWVERVTTLSSSKAVTTPDGGFSATFQPNQAGEYRAVVEITDPYGSRVSSESDLWVSGPGDWEDGPTGSSLSITMDKRSYAPNEEIRGLIQAEKPGGSALLTVEGADLILARVIPLSRKQTPFNLGALPEIAPGAEVSIAYIRNKRYYSGQTGIKVDLARRRLNISINTDRPEVKPGEEVTYTLRATNDSGEPVRAELSLGVVDEGIYAIAEDAGSPIDAFYSPRWSQVSTEYSFPEIYLDGEDKAPKNLQIRRTFVDTAYWAPQVQTNADGVAKVSFVMPDNLTSWRATVTAFTTGAEMGQAKANIVSRKELMARLSPPAFMVQSDQQKLGAIITNGTDREQEVSVRLKTTGLAREGDEVKKVTVAARTTQTLSWPVTAEALGDAKMELAAWTAGGLSDGLELGVNVRPKGIKKVDGRGGTVRSEVTESFTLEPNAVKGSLQVRIDPTPISAVVGSLESLVEFPYGCTEQTLARFVPAVAARQVINLTGLVPKAIEAKLPKVIDESLARLSLMQHQDGGWGWWETDDSGTLMTASVLEGLSIARASGISVPQGMLARGLAWSRERLKGEAKRDWREDIGYLAGAHLLFEDNPDAVRQLRAAAATTLAAKPEKAAPTDLARLAVDMNRLSARSGLPDDKATADKLYARAKSAQQTSGPYGDFWGEGRGRILMALAEFEPNSDALRRALVATLSTGRNSDFGGTRATALVILGAIRASGENGGTTVSGRITLSVNGEELAAREIAPGNLGPIEVDLPQEKLKEGANSLVIRAEGLSPFYQASLERFIPDAIMAAAPGKELSVTRTYHRVESKQMEDGSIRRELVQAPIEDIKSGEVFRVQLVVSSTEPLFYVVVEDPLPSNCAIVETDDPFSFADWSQPYTRQAFYPDRAAFFFESLRANAPVTFNYAVRGEAPGKSVGLPATASLFYTPGVFARSAGATFEVRE